jgi:hypothetical protein
MLTACNIGPLVKYDSESMHQLFELEETIVSF